jgi:predicted nucleic acid-binding protein
VTLTYVDTSVVACALLPDEDQSQASYDALRSGVVISGSILIVEIAATLARSGRRSIAEFDPHELIDVFDPPETPWQSARAIATAHRVRSLDALHLAFWQWARGNIEDSVNFLSFDKEQLHAARTLGAAFHPLCDSMI